MTGYQFIKRKTVRELSKLFGCGWAKANAIKRLSVEGLTRSPDVCPQLLDFSQKHPCNFKITECRTCVRHFLITEIPGTERIIDGPCLTCRDPELCPGYCKEREEYDNEID